MKRFLLRILCAVTAMHGLMLGSGGQGGARYLPSYEKAQQQWQNQQQYYQQEQQQMQNQQQQPLLTRPLPHSQQQQPEQKKRSNLAAAFLDTPAESRKKSDLNRQQQNLQQQKQAQLQQQIQQQNQQSEAASSSTSLTPVRQGFDGRIPQSLSSSALDGSGERDSTTPPITLLMTPQRQSGGAATGSSPEMTTFNNIENALKAVMQKIEESVGYSSAAFDKKSSEDLTGSFRQKPSDQDLFTTPQRLVSTVWDKPLIIEGEKSSTPQRLTSAGDQWSPSARFNQSMTPPLQDQGSLSISFNQSSTPPLVFQQSARKDMDERSFGSTPELKAPGRPSGQSIGKRVPLNIARQAQSQENYEAYKNALETLKRIAVLNNGIPGYLLRDVERVVNYFVTIINDNLPEVQGAHVIRIDPRIVKAYDKISIDFQGGHLSGTSKKLKDYGLVNILKDEAFNDCRYYVLHNLLTGIVYTKSEFPEFWKPDGLIEFLGSYEIFKNVEWRNADSGTKDVCIGVDGFTIKVVRRADNSLLTAYPELICGGQIGLKESEKSMYQMSKDAERKKERDAFRASKESELARLKFMQDLPSTPHVEDVFGTPKKQTRRDDDEIEFSITTPSRKNVVGFTGNQQQSAQIKALAAKGSANQEEQQSVLVDRPLFETPPKKTPTAKESATNQSAKEEFEQYTKGQLFGTTSAVKQSKSVTQQQAATASTAAAWAENISKGERTAKVLSITPKKQ